MLRNYKSMSPVDVLPDVADAEAGEVQAAVTGRASCAPGAAPKPLTDFRTGRPLVGSHDELK